MPLHVNLRHLEDKSLVLEGELTPGELEIEEVDDLMRMRQSLKYHLEVQKLEQNLLLQGMLQVLLDCECARCLVPFQQEVRIPHWICHVPLAGEDKAPVINDCVDLTPYIREDILLEFPQHPLCRNDCEGLLNEHAQQAEQPGGTGPGYETSSDWSELNKLKF